MRNFTLLAASTLFLASGALHAQFPTITAANQIPAINDSIHYVDANTFGFDPDGSGGSMDVEWDYSGLIDAGTTIDFWYVDPSTTIEAANFPTATVAMANSSTANGYEYFNTTASTIARMGYTDASSIYYDQAWNRYEFPITPGVNWSAMYTGTMTSLGAGEDSVTITSGNYQATPDQYGTLTLPASQFGGQPEIFDDVVRVHIIESFQIKAWMFGTPVITITINDDYYFYFDEETKEPILIYGTTTDDAGGAPQNVLRYQTVSGTGVGSVGIEENNELGFSIYPNPSNGLFNIKLVNVSNLETVVTVRNIIGQTIYSSIESSTVTSVDLTQLNSGVYFVSIESNGNKVTKKITIK